ncbi:MAG: Sel1 domain protein repeat-containing protein [Pedosphaera sp.]|nr:Sel1 domain protein repeat-containing protein [Pedosphaera sp.]
MKLKNATFFLLLVLLLRPQVDVYSEVADYAKNGSLPGKTNNVIGPSTVVILGNESNSTDISAVNAPPAEYFGPINSKGLSNLESKAVAEDTKAEYELGVRYAEGNGVKTNLTKAYEWLRKAAQAGDLLAEKRIGEMLLEGEGVNTDIKEGVSWLEKAAKDGAIQAQLELGAMYLVGNAVSQDYVQSFNWFLKAAKQGNAHAQKNTGVMYAQGKGVTKDLEAARDWLEKAALQNEPEASFNLGMMYGSGDGVSKEPKKAFVWFQKAAVEGWPDAQYYVGEMYRMGEGVDKNLPEAVKWFVKAAQGNNSKAQYSLGSLYITGEGLPKDVNKAMELFTSAAKSGNPVAQNDLGYVFLNGYGIAPDYTKAYIWISAAAVQGYPRAEFTLGAMYQEGVGVPRDIVEALKWFFLAADQGFREAILRRAEVVSLMDSAQVEEAKRRANDFKPVTDHPILIDDFAAAVALLGSELQISVKIFGKTKSMLIDTGAEMTYVDAKYCDLLGKPLGRKTQLGLFYNGAEKSFYRCPEIRIGDRQFTPKAAGCENLEKIAMITGEPVDGVLGMNCLQDYVIGFDFNKDIFTIGGAVPETTKRTAFSIPLKKSADTGSYYIEARANESNPIRLEIDTGDQNFITLNDADWQKVFPNGKVKALAAEFVGATGQIGLGKLARLKNLMIGTNIYTNFIASVVPGSNLPSRLGLEFLRRHLVTIDYPNMMFYLLPSKHFGDSEEANMSGLHLLSINGKIMVYSIDKDSLASRTGIKPNDQILSFDGTDSASLKIRTVRAALKEKSGKEITIKIKRDEKILQFKFRLNRFI